MPESATFTDDVKAYWEDTSTVSIIDKNLHRLEIDTVCGYLRPTDHLADIGCGDGEATVEYAKKVKCCVGLERSAHLRDLALQAASSSGRPNLLILPGDILDDVVPDMFDVVVTQRLLINLACWDEQQQAIENIRQMLKPGGRYIMVENTDDGFESLNQMRGSVGLDPIPQHWHNKFFNYRLLTKFMIQSGFKIVTHHNFSLYYFLTRVYTQMFQSFTGCGAAAVKDKMFEITDAAARVAQERFGDQMIDIGHRALGPIQVFVWEKCS